MYVFAYALLLVALLTSVACACYALIQLWGDDDRHAAIVEKGHILVSGAFIMASAVLLKALVDRDYTVSYVASYTDNALDIFYRYAAFWAGQQGSMLFWALSVAIMGSIFALTGSYRAVPARTKLWFWVFFFTVTAFFATLMAVWSNPFLLSDFTPEDGRGMNPLLQNPGMIIHPPLLFLGYGGFTVPSCMALAQAAASSGKETPWYTTTRGFLLSAWCFLTAGILLGAWWAYMELGWGGYWAWDPVENASLIPWLIGTAALHTLAIERARGKLFRVNVFLISLTTVSGFFATYLVRSGVIQSVHAFGQGPVGKPLFLYICFLTLVTLLVSFLAKSRGEPLEEPVSREGGLCLTAWLFMILAVIILCATMWPVISRLWSSSPIGLDANFYNRVCLPVATGILVLLALCPWLNWKSGSLNAKGLIAVLVIGAVVAATAWFLGYRKPLPLAAQFAAGAIAAGCVLALLKRFLPGGMGSTGIRPGTIGTHLGVALVAIGIAFSGPYKVTAELSLDINESTEFEGFTVTMRDWKTARAIDYDYIVAELDVADASGKLIATMRPEKRAYDKFEGMYFSEVDVSLSLGREVYASVSGLDRARNMVVNVSIEPLVSWIWIGGVIMSLLPLLNARRRRKTDAEGE